MNELTKPYYELREIPEFLQGTSDKPWRAIGDYDVWAWLKTEAEIIAIYWLAAIAAVGLLAAAIQWGLH